jgi:putative transposase
VGLSRNALIEPVVIKDKDKALASRIEQLARRHKQWGVLKIYRRLRKQGELVNHKRVRRLYRRLGLSLRKLTTKDQETIAGCGAPATAKSHSL